MKVAIACDVLGSENNGTTIAAMNLVRSLRSKGHTVKIICPDQDKKGADGYVIVPRCRFGKLLDDYVEKNGVTIAKADDEILRQSLRGADVVHVMEPFSVGRHSLRLAHEMGIPVTGGFHAQAENLTSHLFMKNLPVANRLAYNYYAGLYSHCDAIHYPTQFVRDIFEELVGPTNGYVISNGVNKSFVRREVPKPPEYGDRFVIQFTGRYSKEKSHWVLIDAVSMSKYRDKIQLLLAGMGPLEKTLKKRCERVLPIQPVFNFFSRKQMADNLSFADLYVHPAEIEAEGIACIEAIACGLVPIIADSPRCATKAFAIDEKNLFHYNDPRDLARKIDWWLEHPQEKALRSAEYLSYAKEQFDQDVCMDKMENMLLETVSNCNNRVCGASNRL